MWVKIFDLKNARQQKNIWVKIFVFWGCHNRKGIWNKSRCIGYLRYNCNYINKLSVKKDDKRIIDKWKPSLSDTQIKKFYIYATTCGRYLDFTYMAPQYDITESGICLPRWIEFLDYL